jgi:integrase
MVDKDYTESHYSSLIIDNKINEITADLPRECANTLHSISNENASVIIDYIHAMKTEINPSINYRRNNIKLLCNLSKYHNNYSFRCINRENILTFLDSFRKSEATDPLHKWIGTYNTFRMQLLRFFKWLYYPDIEPNWRSKPSIIENIPQLKRKEKSIYKPTDLWTAEDDALFLKYCPSNRNRCFHAMSWDTGCRPHELLKLRTKDIVFKSAGNKQYAEILVNGKTGSRHIPLIDSIPYVKDYLDHEHPQPANPNAIFLCGNGKSLGRVIGISSLYRIYKDYRTDFFPKLLVDPNIQPEDKQKIRELLKKPWNPYIRRHSALTEKSKILKEHTLRQFAGWTTGSNMPQKYLHYFGNEASESLLEAYGIITKDQKMSDTLRPKQCPNCNEPNKPDGKFCAKCRMVLTYDAYSETLESEKQKEDKLSAMEDKFNSMQGMLEKLITGLSNIRDKQQFNAITQSLFSSGILKSVTDNSVLLNG